MARARVNRTKAVEGSHLSLQVGKRGLDCHASTMIVPTRPYVTPIGNGFHDDHDAEEPKWSCYNDIVHVTWPAHTREGDACDDCPNDDVGNRGMQDLLETVFAHCFHIPLALNFGKEQIVRLDGGACFPAIPSLPFNCTTQKPDLSRMAGENTSIYGLKCTT